MVYCYILWRKHLETLIACEFLYLYWLRKAPGKEEGTSTVGWYDASSRGGTDIITDVHNQRAIKKWQKKWFFATQNWEAPSSSYPLTF